MLPATAFWDSRLRDLIVSSSLCPQPLTHAADDLSMKVVTDTELIDSIELFGDWRALRERIATDDDIFIRGLLDPALVRAVGRHGLASLQHAGWIAPSVDPVTATPTRPPRAVRMRDAFGDRGYMRIFTGAGFNAIPFTTPMADLMGQILGPAGFSILHLTARPT